MARYTDAVCRLCRREGEKLFLKGARCYTPKCSMDKRPYPPGMHGKMAAARPSRESDYGKQLRAKQRLAEFTESTNVSFVVSTVRQPQCAVKPAPTC